MQEKRADWENSPWGGRYRLLLSSDRTGSSEIALGLAELDAGEALAMHRHEQAEFQYLLSGTGYCEIDGRKQEMRAGEALFIPAGAAHMTVNEGGEPLRFLFGFAANRLDDVRHVMLGGKPETDDASLPAMNDPGLNNPDSTPGTGMLPEIGEADSNPTPTG